MTLVETRPKRTYDRDAYRRKHPNGRRFRDGHWKCGYCGRGGHNIQTCPLRKEGKR